MNAQAVDLNIENKPTVISLFAGCGGSSLGYQLAGYKELLAVEWESSAVSTFKLNFPNISIYSGDITKLSSKACMSLAGIKPGELDVLDGSPPCQGFSTAGNRLFTDPRNSLFKEFTRLLKDLQPKVFVMENVTGMIKSFMKQAYLQITQALRECGYLVKGQVMNAMYFDVPQSRERVILIGVRSDLRVEPTHPKPSNAQIPCKKVLEPYTNVCNTNYKGRYTQEWHKTKFDQSVTSGFADYKLNPKRPAHTVRKNGSFWHYAFPYPLNARGYARLSSFPDSFKWINQHSAKNGIGNAVPPNLMKAIALH